MSRSSEKIFLVEEINAFQVEVSRDSGSGVLRESSLFQVLMWSQGASRGQVLLAARQLEDPDALRHNTQQSREAFKWAFLCKTGHVLSSFNWLKDLMPAGARFDN